MTKTTYLFILLLFEAHFASSQITGVLADSATKKALPLGTISVYTKAENRLIEYQISGRNGEFSFSKLPLKRNLYLTITYIGYRQIRTEFILEKDKRTIPFGTLFLSPQSTNLGEVIIEATRPPVVYRNDTIQFNVDHISLIPNSVVEDLLKRLPGIFIEKDGSILYNGRKVDRITLDGKEYFSNDLKIATQNLPAGIIDNIQITVNKDAREQNPTIGVNDIANQLNIILKKGAKNKWLGNVYGGVGSSNRYELGGIANRFKDTIQFNLILLSNNANKTGFTFKNFQNYNLASQYTTSGISAASILSQGTLPFYSNDLGVAESIGAGLNINYSPKLSQTSSFQYFFGRKYLDIALSARNTMYLNDTILNRSTNSEHKNVALSHTLTFTHRIKKPHSTFNIKSNLIFFESLESGITTTSFSTNKNGTHSTGYGVPTTVNKYLNYSQDASYTHIFIKNKRRKLLINNLLQFSNGSQDVYSPFNTIYYIPSIDTVYFNQFRSQFQPFLKFTNAITYIEPISKNVAIKLNSKLDINNKQQRLSVYDSKSGNVYNSYNPRLSDQLKRTLSSFDHNITVFAERNRTSIDAGLSILTQNDKFNSNYLRSLTSKTTRLAPYIRINVNNFSLSYLSQIIPVSFFYRNIVSDSSNPYSVIQGNPSLINSIQNKLSGYFYRFNPKTRTNFNFSIGYNRVENDIVYKKTITFQGNQLLMPINSNNSFSITSNIALGKDYKMSTNIQYSLLIRNGMNFSRKQILLNNLSEFERILSLSPSLAFSIYKQAIFELKTDYQFRTNVITYSTPQLKSITVTEHEIGANAVVFFTNRFFLESNLKQRYYHRPLGSFSYTLLTESTSYMMHQKRLQLKLTVFDALNTNQNYVQYTNLNSVNENQTNILQRYLLLSAHYAFGQSSK